MTTKLEMKGSFRLDKETIDQNVILDKPGNYRLGHRNESKDTFVVEYVGRSDDNLNRRLHEWIDKSYKRFKMRYANNPKEAFENECKEYHHYSNLDNEDHPKKPDGTNLKCPYCNYSEQ
ncbi:MAG: hypothetical protein ABSG28_08170 [Methanoregula sp.]|jgi:hypothetical protein|uniref:hypothetical protein n=1 Tax=Methanoregula sp. TaxID=2052170 RepID=UPI003C2A597E